MKNIKLLIFLMISQSSFSQIITKDLDKDGIKDIIAFDHEHSKLSCNLSTNNFKPVMYYGMETMEEPNSGIRETKSGFEFFVNHMRAGFANQFRYEKKDKKIRLIGMSRYELGSANHDGSGESSVNLLTNNYIGEWNYYDDKNEKLIKMQPIKTKMYFPKIYLENYDTSYQIQYLDKCTELYHEQKKKMKNQK